MALLSAPAVANADHGAGSIRLGAGSTLLSVEHLPEPGASTILYGLPIFPYQTGFHFGYLLTDEIYLGLQLAAGAVTVDTGSAVFGNSDILFFTMLPRFAYQMALTSALNVYFGAEAGFSIFGDPDGNPTDIFKAAGVVGASFFATDSFSIDGVLSFGFVHRPDTENAGIQVGLNIILSGWMGLGDSATSSSQPEPERRSDTARDPEPEPEPEDEAPAYEDPEGGLQ